MINIVDGFFEDGIFIFEGNMIGNKYNKWTIIEDSGRNKSGSRIYKCRCECGNESVITFSDLKKNSSTQCRQCGHKNRRLVDRINISTIANNYKHGYNRTPTYKSWQLMKARCNPETKTYHSKRTFKWYGSKNITVCERWKNSFIDFLQDMGEKPFGYQLDRINSDGNYEPGNCRWATVKENNHNRRCVKNKN